MWYLPVPPAVVQQLPMEQSGANISFEPSYHQFQALQSEKDPVMCCLLIQTMVVLSLQRWDGTQPDSGRANTLFPSTQVWTTQLPARPPVPQLLETAPSKRPPSHISSPALHKRLTSHAALPSPHA